MAFAHRKFTDFDRTRPDVDGGTMETLGMERFEALKSLPTAFYGPPMDPGVTNRNGSRFDSYALRAVENLGPFNDPLLCAPIHEMDVADIDDVPAESVRSSTKSSRHSRLRGARDGRRCAPARRWSKPLHFASDSSCNRKGTARRS